MKRNFQEYLDGARAHYDAVLGEKINTLVELTGIERERFIRINPMDFLETISGLVERNGNIAEFINKYKTQETFFDFAA